MSERGWWDLFRLFKYAFVEDPLAKKTASDELPVAGLTTPDLPDVRSGDSGASAGVVRLVDSNDFVDLSSITNRQSRYKEYERLRNIAEIESAMTVMADESCVVGDTLVSTPFGAKTIQWLAENRADEKFMVYTYNFDMRDFGLSWAYAPRKVKTAPTVTIVFGDGETARMTPDHRVLLRNGKWKPAGQLKYGDSLMAFHRVKPPKEFLKKEQNHFPRVFSHNYGFTNERALLEQWKQGFETQEFKKPQKFLRMMAEGYDYNYTLRFLKTNHVDIHNQLVRKLGMSLPEAKWLLKNYRNEHKVISLIPDTEPVDVYDISVSETECFCTDKLVLHNCQVGENKHTIEIECEDDDVKEELDWLFHTNIKIDDNIWKWVKNTYIYGDWFGELVMQQDPKDGIAKIAPLPPDSIFRIETTRGRLVEFQQSKEGPDTHALTTVRVEDATEEQLASSKAIRFDPNQIVHVKVGDDRKIFYPYGVSLIEPARGPAHMLRLMEDAMLVYRLTRSPERRVFYIDIGTLNGSRAEAFMERMKDQFKKRKTYGRNNGVGGASAVEERWQSPSIEEDYFVPVRPGVQTRIETMPGAASLGEVDDVVYFRNKLMTALNFPKNYFNTDDANTTRMTLSAQDVRFARMIERLQSSMERGLLQIAQRHLFLRGFVKDKYRSLNIIMTPPSDYRELARGELMNLRVGLAGSVKGMQLMSDEDILVEFMKYPKDKAKEFVSRSKIQKFEELKIGMMAQNPGILGFGNPGDTEPEISADPNGSQDSINPDEMPSGGGLAPPQAGDQGPPDNPDEGGNAPPQEDQPQPGGTLPEPTPELIRKYDLEIEDYSSDADSDDVDNSEES